MRRLAILVLLVAILAAVVPYSAAQSSGRVQAGPTPTHIQALLPGNVTVGTDSLINAILHDAATGAPIPQENLSFAVKTKFGSLALGTVLTNAQGQARVDYVPSGPGTATIQVAFAGDSAYAASNTSLAVTASSVGPGPAAPALPADRVIVLVILAVVGGVWATYAFVAFLILGIRADRPEEEPTSELKEKEYMVDDEEPTPKRVPGRSNASGRAVAIVAAVALVLGGLAVTLAGMSALTTRASGYTPEQVSLQVTVIPDFRGATYDSFVPDELVVHQGDTVTITIWNEDTMDHGFAIDALGISKILPAASQDNTTGDITPTSVTVTFVAPATGAYTWYCTQPCGAGHLTMVGTLVVLPD